MFGFQLWREFKLSIAEILSVFNDIEIVYSNNKVLIIKSKVLNNLDFKDFILNKADSLWWSIKIFEIIWEEWKDINYKNKIAELARESDKNKYSFWISLFWLSTDLRRIVLDVKKFLKSESIASRFVNKSFANLSSAQIIWEKLVESESDFSIIYEKNLDINYLWKTIWIQDIEKYSRRDYSKDRDMQVGMLPPKLSQMMINISRNTKNSKDTELKAIYDPFIWLWTILIEWAFMWIENLYWSDLSQRMVDISITNLNKVKAKLKNLDTFRDKNINIKIEKLNAKFINEASFWSKEWKNKDKNNTIDSIVTEWYLWEVMTRANISDERINTQKVWLIKVYKAFFANLKKTDFKWSIVVCFPFWELNKKYIYFEEVYNILKEETNILDIFWDNNKIEDKPKETRFQASKLGSLLYKRPNQLVWREIFKLELKK